MGGKMKKMRRLISIQITVVAVLSTLVLGRASAVEPLGQSSLPPGGWVSGTQVQNVGTAPATVMMIYHSEDGSTTYNGAGITVAPGASGTFYLEPGVPDGFLGSAVVYSSEPVSSVTNVDNLSTGARGSYNGFETGASQVNFPLVKREYWGASTAIFIQNTDTDEVTVTPSYKRGAETWTGAAVAINAGFAKEFSAADDGVPTGFVGSAVFSATGDIAGTYVEYMGNTASVGTGFPTGVESTKVYVPLVKKFYWGAVTGIQVQNVGSLPAPIFVTYKSVAGVEYVSTVGGGADVEVGASRTYYLDPVLPGSAGSPDGFLGSAIITSAQPIVAIVNEAQLDGSIATTNAGINDGLQTTKISVPLVKKFYWGSASGIQVQNVSSAPAPISVTYKSVGGVEYVSNVGGGASLAPGASRTYYLDPVLPGSAGSPDGFLGAAIITSAQPIVAIVNEGPVDMYTTGDGMSTNAFNLAP